MRITSVKKLIHDHQNINSLRNKFEFLVEFIRVKVDSIMISERKLYESFPFGQFKINAFNAPFRLDRSIMLFILF